MYKILDRITKDKNILILGFGKEGKSTLTALEKVNTFKSITIADINDIGINSYKKICGDNYQDTLDDYDVVFKSPGIVLKNPYENYKCLITSQMDVFLECYRKQCIGITGSKGKSTTTSLTKHMFEYCGYDTLLAGNIGIPVFDLVDNIKKDSVIVLEISCHQLEYIRFNPHISVLLNIYQEHLDHYGTFEKYKEAKENIYKYQDKNDYLIVNPINKPKLFKCKSHIKKIGSCFMPFTSLNDFECKLKGDHNYFNCEAINEIAHIYKIKPSNFVASIMTFEPLEHRLEYVGNKNGIDYYNDSISTICESCISAVNSVHNIETILIGGMDRGIDYSPLVNFLKKGYVKNIVCMYDSGKRIYDELMKLNLKKLNIVYVDDLSKAFLYAKDNTSKGNAIVLSPAAASYGYFKNFEERGRAFKQMVNLL